jgi:type IX secretion system PorP/SprF family membrane protein
MLLLVLHGQRVYAQVDPHFSQYYAYPMYLNPGLTGVLDGDYRVTAMYRNQWSGIGSGISTPAVSADMKTAKNINLGVNIMNQSAREAGFSSLNAYISLAYTGIRFGSNGNQHISAGFSLGMLNRRFDQSKFRTGSQWTVGNGVDPSLPSMENLDKTSATVFDAGAGILYYDATPDKKANLFAGFSAYHLTQPEDPFIAAGTNSKLPARYSLHGGVKLLVSENFSLIPNLLYMRQGNAEEKMAGAYGQLGVNETTDLLLGANYRFKDAISPYIGFYYKDFVLGASYDITHSDLSKYNGNANSFEISLSFIGRKKSKTEVVPFVCPRM